MNYINLDGAITEAISVALHADNRAFRFGYGLFETMLYNNGALLLKDYHWERLYEGMQQLGFDVSSFLPRSAMEEQIVQTINKNGLMDMCRIRLQVFAGSGSLSDGPDAAHFLIECFAINPEMLLLNEHGLCAGIAQGLQKSPNALANLKSCNALLYALAAQQAVQNRWDDALISNTNNNIIESTIANIFVVKNDILYTPPLTEGCIAGAMRRHVITQLLTHGIVVKEEILDIPAFLNADELFLTNSIRRIRWIKTLGENAFSNEYTRYIYNLIFG